MDSSNTRKLGSLDPNHTAVMVCDLQEKFAPSILHFDTIVQNSDRLVQAANILQMPVLATEQYPKVNTYKDSKIIIYFGQIVAYLHGIESG